MILRRSLWLFVAVALLGLPGCEPYMSMTDQMSQQARRATTLLPENPRYVGMVDLETVLGQLGELTDVSPADSLHQTDNPRIRAFLDATGLDPKTDLTAVYGALEADDTVSAVLFANVTPEELNTFLDQAPAGTGRAATYQGVPYYQLALHSDAGEKHVPDSLTAAYVGDGMWALSSDANRVTDMVDRHQAETGGFRANADYMDLVKRVGHGSTAWLVGRDVLDSALEGDSSSGAAQSTSVTGSSSTNQAGIQTMLAQWSDRVLGLSNMSPLDGGPGEKMERLKDRIREQAVSLTLTDATLDGKLYLTMRDDASASSVVDISRGVLAALRLAKDDLSERHRDLLDGVHIDRNGAVVHVQFTVDRTHIRRATHTARLNRPAYRSEPSIHRVHPAIRRTTRISGSRLPLKILHTFVKAATSFSKGVSTTVP